MVLTADYVPAKVPRAGEIVSIMLQMSTFGVLAVCISKYRSPPYDCHRELTRTVRRTQWIQKWTALPLAMWCKYFRPNV